MSEKVVRAGFGVMILKEGRVLLGQRHVDPEKASSMLNGAGKWTMPGGKLDFGETLEEGVARETMEETGLKVNNLKLISVQENIIETAHFITIGFLCEDFEGSPEVMEPDEITKWEWFDINDLPSPMYPASAKIIELFNEKVFYKK